MRNIKKEKRAKKVEKKKIQNAKIVNEKLTMYIGVSTFDNKPPTGEYIKIYEDISNSLKTEYTSLSATLSDTIRKTHNIPSYKYIELVTNSESSNVLLTLHFEDIVVNALYKHYPQYRSSEYNITAYHYYYNVFVIIIGIMDEHKTAKGNSVLLLPELIYPGLNKLGLSKHAITRLNERCHIVTRPDPESGPTIAGIAKSTIFWNLPKVLIPYKDDIHALYVYCESTFFLLGYIPIITENSKLIGLTYLTPGFKKTPEYNMTQNEIHNNNGITIKNGKLYKYISNAEFTVPYENLKILPHLVNICKNRNNPMPKIHGYMRKEHDYR